MMNRNNFNHNFEKRESLNDSDLSYTYIYESIDSQTMKKLQELNIVNRQPNQEYISNHNRQNNAKQSISGDSEFTYIYESITDNDKSDYTYVYTYGQYDNDKYTNEYTYTYDEPSAGQINLFENQQNNELNKALKTRNILLDQNLNNSLPTNVNSTNINSPKLSISNQPSIFIQRSPKKIINKNQNQQKKKTSPKPIKKQPVKLTPHKKSILRKINLLEEQLKYLDSSSTIANDISSTEFTESETKDDPKIQFLQHKLSQITGKNIYNPNDSYSPGNSQYTYTYAYEDTYEDEIEKYHSKPKPKLKPRSRSTTRNKPKKLDRIPNKNSSTPTPRTPNLVLQTFNDNAISIINEKSPNEEHVQKNKVDLQISSSIQSEKVLKQAQNENVKQSHSNSATIESINNDEEKIEIKERSAKLKNEENNEKHEKTIKKIYRKIKVNKPDSRHSKKNEIDYNTNPSLYQNSPKTAKSIMQIQDEDELNESEFAALNPVDAMKYTSTRSIDFTTKAKPIENNDVIKIKIVEDANVPDVDRFCVFYIEGNEDSVKRTNTVHKGQNIFNDTFEYQLNELVASKLVIFLKKQDLIKEDKIMGTTKIDLQKVPPNSTLSKWIPLKSDSGVKIESKIHLVLKRETKITEKDEIFDKSKENSNITNSSHHRKTSHHKKQVKKQHNKIRLEDSVKVETKEAEAQVSLLSESYSEEESINDQNSQISNNEDNQESKLSEYSYESNHEDKEQKVPVLDEDESHKSNGQKKKQSSNLHEESYEYDYEIEFDLSKGQKERKVQIQDKNSNKSNHEEESYISNNQKNKQIPTLDENSYNSNYEEESQKSNKDELQESDYEEKSQELSKDYESQKSNHEYSQKSNHDYSQESNHEYSHESNHEYSQKSNHEDSSKIQFDDNSAASTLTALLSYSDTLQSEKIKAVGRSAHLHNSSSFMTSISDSNNYLKKVPRTRNIQQSSSSKADEYESNSKDLLNSDNSDLSPVHSDFVPAEYNELNKANISYSSSDFGQDNGNNIQSRGLTNISRNNQKSTDSKTKTQSRSSNFTNNENQNKSGSLNSDKLESPDINFTDISGSFTSNITESPSLSGGSSPTGNDDSNGKRRRNNRNISQSENESERDNNSNTSDSFNNLVVGALFKEDKIHDFTSEFNDSSNEMTKKSHRSRKSNTSSRNIKMSETKRKQRKLNDSLEITPGNISDSSSSPKRRNNNKDRNGAYLSASGSTGSRNAIKKLSSLSDSDNLSENLNNESLKISIASQNARTPKNMPDWQDLSSEDDSLNLNNSNHLVNSKISDNDSLDSSSSRKKRTHRSSKSSSSSRNISKTKETSTTNNNTNNNDEYYSLWTSRATTSKPVIYWTVEYSSSTAPPNYKKKM